MCGRFTRDVPWSVLHAALNITRPTTPQNMEPETDVRPTTRQWVTRPDGDGFALDRLRWGLVPFWRGGKPLKDTEKGKGDGFKLTTFNARSETMATSAVFKDAFARRRCLVPASGWYEWTGDKGDKTKWRFSRADGDWLAFAGIWDTCQTADEGVVESFTLITHAATGHMAEYHDRAPVVLERDEWSTWLSHDLDVTALLAPGRAERFEVCETA